MSKHAYLILAHTNIPQLAVLLSMLDYDQNDIFVHIDAKQKEYDKSMLQSAVKKAACIFWTIRFRWNGGSIAALR